MVIMQMSSDTCENMSVFQEAEEVAKNRKTHNAENVRLLPLTEENIELICGEFGMKCSVAFDVVFLKTKAGYWRIYIKDDKVDRVFHGNYRMSKTDFGKKKKKYNEGFHEQKISTDNFYDVVRYIYYHDKYMYKYKKVKWKHYLKRSNRRG